MLVDVCCSFLPTTLGGPWTTASPSTPTPPPSTPAPLTTDHVARRPSHGPASMLDLDDDPRSPYADTLGEDDDDDAEHCPRRRRPRPRLSYLGPKMRFHSRAPWEMDGEPLAEEDEDTHHLVAGLPFGRSKHGHGAASPRPSFQAARPSGESSRSTIPPKRSFETINSQISYPLGAL